MQALLLFLGVSGAFAGTYNVGWSPVTGATEYIVHYSPDSTVTTADPSKSVPPSECKPATAAQVAGCGWPDTAGTPFCTTTLSNFTDNTPKWISVRACVGTTCSVLKPIIVNGWPDPVITNVTRDTSQRATKVHGTNFKAGATVTVGGVAATIASMTPTEVTLGGNLLTGVEVKVRNGSEEAPNGCAPLGVWNVAVPVPVVPAPAETVRIGTSAP